MGGSNPVKKLFSGGGSKKKTVTVVQKAIKRPTGITDLKPDQLAKIRPHAVGAYGAKGAQGLIAPSYLKIPEGMSTHQQRSYIASNALSGTAGFGKDKATLGYMRGLAYTDLMPQGGGAMGSPTSVERQYMRETFGENTGSTGQSYLSAMERAFKKFR